MSCSEANELFATVKKTKDSTANHATGDMGAGGINHSANDMHIVSCMVMPIGLVQYRSCRCIPCGSHMNAQKDLEMTQLDGKPIQLKS